MSKHDDHSHGNDERDYQDRDIQIKPILIFGLVTALVTLFTFLGIKAYFYKLASQAEYADQPVSTVDRQLPPEPRLQVWEASDLAAYRAKEQTVLHTYAWIDKSAGVVRLPVERAMELALQRGFPIREPQSTP